MGVQFPSTFEDLILMFLSSSGTSVNLAVSNPYWLSMEFIKLLNHWNTSLYVTFWCEIYFHLGWNCPLTNDEKNLACAMLLLDLRLWLAKKLLNIFLNLQWSLLKENILNSKGLILCDSASSLVMYTPTKQMPAKAPTENGIYSYTGLRRLKIRCTGVLYGDTWKSM